MLNSVVLIGRLTRDPELRYTPNGVAVASFTLAVDRSRKNAAGERETDFIPIVVWQQQAENCNSYLAKGKMVAVDGRLQVRNYEDKDGNKRTMTEVIVESVQFLSPRDSNGQQHVIESTDQPGVDSTGTTENFKLNDDDLPF